MRSLVAMTMALFLLGVLAPISLYLFVIPWMAIRGKAAEGLGPAWVAGIARSLVRLMELGGAQFRFEGHVDCDTPSILIMNHQSLLDIPPLIRILKKRLPRFVVRAKYTTWVPTVSPAVRYLGCISVDPHRDRAAAALALHNAAKAGITGALLLYPEGHRSKDGEIQAFRPAGMTALLAVKPLPVWTLVNDGLWRLRTLGDAMFSLTTVRCTMRVVDCVMSPEDPADLPAFIEDRRQTMIRELARMRAEAWN